MIMFVCGLNPVVGCQLSEYAKNVVNKDADFINYRENPERKNKIKEIYMIQCKWFSEMKQNLSYTHNTDRRPTLHITDVYLDEDSDNDDVSVASELVSMENNSIVSVYLDEVEHPVHSIIQHLPGCQHLTALYIRNITHTQDVELLAEVLPQLVELQCVVYGYDILYNGEKCPTADTAVVRAVQHLPALRRIELDGITLTDTVTLPPHLQKVKLVNVCPAHFILKSLPWCLNLTSLYIIACRHTMKECEVLASVLPQLQHLQYIHYDDGYWSRCGSAGHAAVVSALQHLTQLTHIVLKSIDLGDAGTLLVTPQMTQLQEVELKYVEMSDRRWTEFFSSLQHATQLTHIELESIDLGDACTLLITPQMTQLQEVKLKRVKMSSRRWTEFVSSLLRVQHKVTVTLKWTNVDDDTVNIIHDLPNCTLIREVDKPGNRCYTLKFIAKPPAV